MIIRKKFLWFLLLLVFLGGCYPTSDPSSSLPAACDYDAASLEETLLDALWRFSTDPSDIGLAEAWYLPSFDDHDWGEHAPGAPWESDDIEYDGVAWYRAHITVPRWKAVYLSFGQPDDSATLWINGAEVGSWGLEELGPRPILLNLLDFGKPGTELLLAFRIDDIGGEGGLKVPLRWGTEPHATLDDMQYISWLAFEYPGWPMPDWSEGEPFGWTMTGGLDVANEALLSSEGALAPWATAPTVEVWLYDPESGLLASGASQRQQFSLFGDALPIPVVQWDAFGTHLQTVSFYDREDRAVRWRIDVSNKVETARELTLLVVVRPFAANKATAPIQKLAFQGKDRLSVNDHPFLIAHVPPDAAGVGQLFDAMSAAAEGEVPKGKESICAPRGDAMAVWTYPLQLAVGESRKLHFAFPSASEMAFPEVAVDVDERLETAAARWEAITSQVTFELPDETLAKTFKASMGYLLLAIDPDGPHPGPLAHDAVWVRDAAYIGLALLQVGQSDVVRDYIPLLLANQDPDGRILPIQGPSIPWDDDEWDAQGQIIFLVTSYYRYTKDMDALRTWYPAVRSAANFLVELRASASGANKTETDPTYGLLPPSKSAEDLGPAHWHHYWDNFWAVAGLEEAAYAAQELGEPADAAWMQEEADQLRGAISASIESVMGSSTPDYIPSAVENVQGSAIARGTVPALWPVEVLSRESPLLTRSFEHYYNFWVAPSEGGFRHHAGHFWPYGGLELAHAYLRLGRSDVVWQILSWTAAHQTLPGTFAWAEQVNPQRGGFSGGDMPHAWAAANYATLTREMLVSERDNSLELFRGVPLDWFRADKTIGLEQLPTHFGELSLRTESTLIQDVEPWQGVLRVSLAGAEPPAGFRWQLSPEMKAQLVGVEGPVGTRMDGNWVVVPQSGGMVTLQFADVD